MLKAAQPTKKSDNQLFNREMEYGEVIKQKKEDLKCDHNFGIAIPTHFGTLFCTNYKIVFKPKIDSNSNAWLEQTLMNQQNVKSFFKLPLGYIFSIEYDKNLSFVEILSKDQRQFRFYFNSVQEAKEFRDNLRGLCFYDSQNNNQQELLQVSFAQRYQRALLGPINQQTCSPELLYSNKIGWELYNNNVELEFRRQGCIFIHDPLPYQPSRKAIFQSYKQNYKLCGTYPDTLIFPAKVSESVLKGAAEQRSSRRLPVLTYYDKDFGTSIWRSSQPSTGLFKKKGFDEELIKIIGECNQSSKNMRGLVMIFDARPKLNAYGNKLKGGGFEDCGDGKAYSNCKLEFCGIDNIHVVRSAIEKMYQLSLTPIGKESRQVNQFMDQKVDQTGYRQIMQYLLDAVNYIVQSMTADPFANVLIHCSDGWDRTSQLCALAQLLLDPYYRTFKGFQVLIDKDWLSFGHMFGRRCGHNSSQDHSNRAPIFLQFLDAVHQIWHQMASQFEFNLEFLVFLAEHVNSCKYGTFFFNCEQERQLKGLQQETVSIWLEVELREKNDFKNPFYLGADTLKKVKQIPVTSYHRLRVWKEHFFRFRESAEETTYFMDREEFLDNKAAKTKELIQQLKVLKERALKHKQIFEQESNQALVDQFKQIIEPTAKDSSDLIQTIEEFDSSLIESETTREAMVEEPTSRKQVKHQKRANQLSVMFQPKELEKHLDIDADGAFEFLDKNADAAFETLDKK